MNILKHVESEFRRIFHDDDLGVSEPANSDRRAIVIAHSLGTVIAFDYLMGFRRYRVHHSVDVKSFITMGSPIPLFTSAMGHPDSDLKLPPQINRWINIRSPRDGVARPMKPFFRHIPIDEHLVHTTFSPFSSHNAYWTDHDTADIIAAQILSSL
jgi:pimeloyl-ACP methyl ester carboxylesterase